MLTIHVDLEIFRFFIYNLRRIREEGKYCASFHSNILENCETEKVLILWILASKSYCSLSFKINSNIYKPMAHNPYPVYELGNRGACCQGDIIHDQQILGDLD